MDQVETMTRGIHNHVSFCLLHEPISGSSDHMPLSFFYVWFPLLTYYPCVIADFTTLLEQGPAATEEAASFGEKI